MVRNRRFDDLEPELRGDYQRLKGKSRLAWEDAKAADPRCLGSRRAGPCRATQTTTVVSVQVPAASFARRLASCPTRGSIYGEAAGTDKATT
jgi:hypothetical protein